MAEQSYPFDAGSGAAMNEAQWQAMFRRLRQTGVVDGSLNKLAVSADGSAMSVSVATGDAFIEGFFYRNDAAKAMTIATANATNPRIDTVVVRLDRMANSAALAVITGTPAASPVAPTLSATDSLYELPLANVAVPAAAGVIVSGNVTDRRTLTQTFDSAAYAPKNAVKATSRVAQSLPTATTTAVALATEEWDTDGFHDLATNNSRITIPAGMGGRYDVKATAVFADNATGRRVLQLRRNGTQSVARADQPAITVAGAPTTVVATSDVVLAAGDYLEVYLFHDAGGPLALSLTAMADSGGTAISCFLSARKVS